MSDKRSLDSTTIWILLGLGIWAAFIITIVIAIGLYRNNLDPTGTMAVLAGLFSGVVTAVVSLRRRGGQSHDDS